MSDPGRVWFREPLETVAVWWRIERLDGVTLGFTSHDRNLWFGSLLHRTAPGMTPSAIRKSGSLEPDSAEIVGALSHDAIREEDLAAGRFDGAAIVLGLVDWETLEQQELYRGTIGAVGIEGDGFSAELQSLKVLLDRELVVRTSPTCRAEFCGRGCSLSAAAYTSQGTITEVSPDGAAVRVAIGSDIDALAFGRLRILDGPACGLWRRIETVSEGWLLLDRRLDDAVLAGTPILARQGCDHTIATCAARYGNAVNFQGEPYLPGNDLLARYALPGA
ncbi:DUF2163 domain-containing protein [Novosphingobium huizhouense]|uniref:DUF2163 domain-containing protein n=1 Tax=Novosphingobium huizhouense TaxID=2866625 RepID=UPI001CD8B77B|nr:DUF2163 domain-containing protein [Novosphingobium huizhouense]